MNKQHTSSQPLAIYLLAALFFLLCSNTLFAHGVTGRDAEFLQQNAGFDFWVYFYLGAKHMVTGYDHLAFLFGVIFYLANMRSVAVYVSLFAIGHSLTLISGVYFDIRANAYIVDAIIGLSVVYKALDNLGGFKTLFNVQPNDKIAVLAFGLVHGFGLATKLQDFNLSEDGLLGNLLAFNLGVELGQLFALSILVLFVGLWRFCGSSRPLAISLNVFLMFVGFALTAYQIGGLILS